MIRYDKNFDAGSILTLQICHNLITNLFEKGYSPSKQEIPEVKPKNISNHNLPGISKINFKSNAPPNTNR